MTRTPATLEKTLQREIIAECKRREWLVFYSRMDSRTTRPAGEPDLQILMGDGRFLLIECKTAKGKLSDAQLAVQANARKLGHTIYVVRSFEDFLSLV